jgi:hypothetical protein
MPFSLPFAKYTKSTKPSRDPEPRRPSAGMKDSACTYDDVRAWSAVCDSLATARLLLPAQQEELSNCETSVRIIVVC